ncbi:MAG: T9SS type A sorting domain-containing protein [Bacteroidetes bacterium]|nr:T9SS type A sorting domain-containing protein [Bacteroidota bacterium]
MKKILFIICTTLTASITSVFAQLPPVAQALYDSAFANDPIRGQYSIDSGAVAMATADGNSFYLQWFPTGGTPNSHPLLVTLHGSAGNAFDEFFIWHDYVKAKGVGIIAMQWYRGYSVPYPNEYFGDINLYEYIDTALTRIQYPSNKAFFHGFSRGSEISYAVAFRDVWPPKGKNYFCTIMSNSGRVEPDTTYLYVQINSGMYGHTFYNGKKWGMFCGGKDVGIFSNCQSMDSSKLWVEANNGVVGLFIKDDSLGHGGFQLTPAYIDSALNYYLSCYFASSVVENSKNHTIKVFPNPFSVKTTLQADMFLKDASLIVYNSFGQTVKQMNNLSEQTIIFNRDNLPSGLYFLRLTQDNKTISADKLVITDN